MDAAAPDAPTAPANAPVALAVSMDFGAKQCTVVAASEVKAELEHGRFVWVDVDITRAEEARALLAQLGLCDLSIVEDAFSRDAATQLERFEDCIHLVMSGCRLNGRHFELERVDAVFGERYLLTVRQGEPSFMREVRRHYRADFVRFASTPSFMLFELWDRLLDNYLAVHEEFEDRVESVQRALTGDVDEAIFQEASELGSDLLQLRKALLPARGVLTDLATRKSAFVAESTQPFLANMVGTVERVLQDVLVDRDILSDSLNNYMSMVAHRTNKVMGKLTVVSVIFLPLTFLCGVYGMNFEELPELKWSWGYYGFWITAGVIVLGLMAFMRRMKLL